MKIVDALVSPKDIYLDLNALNQRHVGILFVILGFVICSYVAFYLHLDQNHVYQSLFSESAAETSNEEEKILLAETLKNIVPMMGILVGTSESFIILLKILFISFILFLTVKIAQKQAPVVNYRAAFNATVFAFVPSILIALGRIGISISNKNGEIPLEASEFSSIGQLFFDSSSGLYDLFQFINIFDLWSIALLSQFLSLQKICSPTKSLLVASSAFLAVYFIYWLVA